MFAVIRTGGKQYRVAAEDVITVEKVKGAAGDAVEFGEVLMLSGESIIVGKPTVSGATVAAEVVEQTRDEKVIAFKKRRRKNSRRKRGHRQELSRVRITAILRDGRKLSEVTAEAAIADEPANAPAMEPTSTAHATKLDEPTNLAATAAEERPG
jgi:large subunit ribosomal protein L21